MIQPRLQRYAFEEIPANLLYDMLALRSAVFVVEQNSVYLDPDGYDQKSTHLCLFDGPKLIGCSRYFAPGIKYPEASLGRLVIDPTYRKHALGETLLRDTMAAMLATHGAHPIRIEAQAYLENFYKKVGFQPASDIYILDGIPHLEMLKPL